MRFPMLPLAVTALLFVSGCTPDSQTTRVLLPQDTPTAIPQVAVVETLPAGSTVIGSMSADSCSRKTGQPPPSPEEALVNLKIAAASKGAIGLVNVTYRQGDMDLGRNCWAWVSATGTAYR